MSNYLFVVAHPDDEILGGGASICSLVELGNNVDVCILSDYSKTREENLRERIVKSHEILGVRNTYIGDIKCMEFKDENHHSVVKFIENCIKKSECDYIITHHPADLHNDHYYTSIICQEASRLSMRMVEEGINPLKGLLFMEVQSSTDWCSNPSLNRFVPNTFIKVDEKGLEKKIQALKIYDNVIRPMPHPRSEESIKGLAIIRGTQCGCKYAEAFETGFCVHIGG